MSPVVLCDGERGMPSRISTSIVELPTLPSRCYHTGTGTSTRTTSVCLHILDTGTGMYVVHLNPPVYARMASYPYVGLPVGPFNFLYHGREIYRWLMSANNYTGTRHRLSPSTTPRHFSCLIIHFNNVRGGYKYYMELQLS